MNLEECVARLIAPYAMWTEPSHDSDSRDWLDWHFLQPLRERSLEAVRRVFDRREGGQGESLEVKFPRFLGVVSRRPRTEPGVGSSAARPNAAGQWDTVGGGQPGDPWATEDGPSW